MLQERQFGENKLNYSKRLKECRELTESKVVPVFVFMLLFSTEELPEEAFRLEEKGFRKKFSKPLMRR